MMKKIALAATLALGLAGCTTNSTTSLLPTESVYPKALTTCESEPTLAPQKTPFTDQQAAQFLKGEHGAYLDCHDTVASWKQLHDKYQKQYEQQQYGYFGTLWRDVLGESKDD